MRGARRPTDAVYPLAQAVNDLEGQLLDGPCQSVRAFHDLVAETLWNRVRTFRLSDAERACLGWQLVRLTMLGSTLDMMISECAHCIANSPTKAAFWAAFRCSTTCRPRSSFSSAALPSAQAIPLPPHLTADYAAARDTSIACCLPTLLQQGETASRAKTPGRLFRRPGLMGTHFSELAPVCLLWQAERAICRRSYRRPRSVSGMHDPVPSSASFCCALSHALATCTAQLRLSWTIRQSG